MILFRLSIEIAFLTVGKIGLVFIVGKNSIVVNWIKNLHLSYVHQRWYLVMLVVRLLREFIFLIWVISCTDESPKTVCPLTCYGNEVLCTYKFVCVIHMCLLINFLPHVVHLVPDLEFSQLVITFTWKSQKYWMLHKTIPNYY